MANNNAQAVAHAGDFRHDFSSDFRDVNTVNGVAYMSTSNAGLTIESAREQRKEVTMSNNATTTISTIVSDIRTLAKATIYSHKAEDDEFVSKKSHVANNGLSNAVISRVRIDDEIDGINKDLAHIRGIIKMWENDNGDDAVKHVAHLHNELIELCMKKRALMDERQYGGVDAVVLSPRAQKKAIASAREAVVEFNKLDDRMSDVPISKIRKDFEVARASNKVDGDTAMKFKALFAKFDDELKRQSKERHEMVSVDKVVAEQRGYIARTRVEMPEFDFSTERIPETMKRLDGLSVRKDVPEARKRIKPFIEKLENAKATKSLADDMIREADDAIEVLRTLKSTDEVNKEIARLHDSMAENRKVRNEACAELDEIIAMVNPDKVQISLAQKEIGEAIFALAVKIARQEFKEKLKRIGDADVFREAISNISWYETYHGVINNAQPHRLPSLNKHNEVEYKNNTDKRYAEKSKAVYDALQYTGMDGMDVVNAVALAICEEIRNAAREKRLTDDWTSKKYTKTFYKSEAFAGNAYEGQQKQLEVKPMRRSVRLIDTLFDVASRCIMTNKHPKDFFGTVSYIEIIGHPDNEYTSEDVHVYRTIYGGAFENQEDIEALDAMTERAKLTGLESYIVSRRLLGESYADIGKNIMTVDEYGHETACPMSADTVSNHMDKIRKKFVECGLATEAMLPDKGKTNEEKAIVVCAKRSSDGSVVGVFKSITEAAVALNLDRHNVRKAVRKEREEVGGYVFEQVVSA